MLLYSDHVGRFRALGNVSSTAPVRGDFGPPPLVPRLRWRELIEAMPAGAEHPHLPPVHDQGHVGQCNAEATAAAVECCRAAQGLPYVQLSPADLYGRINSGVDRGSYLEDAMLEMVRVGIGTAATSGLLWTPETVGATQDERGRFRVLECHLCRTFAHCMSAVLSGFAIVSGVRWWQGYYPDASGWMRTTGTGRASGHAMMGYKPALRGDGTYGIWHQNSFGERWGPCGGRCVLPEGAYGDAIGGWWAVRQAVSEDGDLPRLLSQSAANCESVRGPTPAGVLVA